MFLLITFINPSTCLIFKNKSIIRWYQRIVYIIKHTFIILLKKKVTNPQSTWIQVFFLIFTNLLGIFKILYYIIYKYIFYPFPIYLSRVRNYSDFLRTQCMHFTSYFLNEINGHLFVYILICKRQSTFYI